MISCLLCLLIFFTIDSGQTVESNTLLLSNIDRYNTNYRQQELVSNLEKTIHEEVTKSIDRGISKIEESKKESITKEAPKPIASVSTPAPMAPIQKVECKIPQLCQKKMLLRVDGAKLSDIISIINKAGNTSIIFFEKEDPVLNKLSFEQEPIDTILTTIGSKLTPIHQVAQRQGSIFFGTEEPEAKEPANEKDKKGNELIIKTFVVANAIPSDDFKKQIQEIWQTLTEKDTHAIVHIDVDTRTITVRGTQRQIDEFASFIESIDSLKNRVRIDIIIATLRKSSFLDFGLNFSGIYNKQASAHRPFGFVGLGGTLTDFPTPTEPISPANGHLYVNPGNLAINLFNSLLDTAIGALDSAVPFLHLPIVFGGPDLNTRRLNLILNAAQEDQTANIVSKPTILATNNQVAKVLVGTSVPIYTTVQDVVQSNIRTLNQLTYKEVGVSIQVLPSISSDKKNVAVDIYIEISELQSGSTRVNSQGVAENPPVFFTAKLKNHVVIENGRTVILGGLRLKNDSSTTLKVPYLEQLPIIGRFFKSIGHQHLENEDFIFLTPTIIE